MEPFLTHTGIVAVLNQADIDTDQILPKQFLKRIERTGFGQFLFFDWRFDKDGGENPEFILNQPQSHGATILVTGANFGCGSSREHAPWALQDYGFRVIIAPSYGDIFYSNCFQNGLLPVKLPADAVDELETRAARHPDYRLTIDLENCIIQDDQGFRTTFLLDEHRKQRLLNGWDGISLILRHENEIQEYEQSVPQYFLRDLESAFD